MLHKELTDSIIKAFYKVYNTLSFGFPEKVYENSLALELKKRGFSAEQQVPIIVHYDGDIVGTYFSDIIVEDTIIVEVKAISALVEENRTQLRNYLRATEHEVGLLMNFGKVPSFERALFTNDRKGKTLHELPPG